MMRSPNTAPDMVYEDTFLINSDITAGYLTAARRPHQELAGLESVRGHRQGRGARPGRQDVRRPGRHRHPRALVQQADLREGRPADDWQPKTWDDILTAARTIKQKVPGVIPLNVYSGKPAGEAAAMQGFEMLLYGTRRTPCTTSDQSEVGRRQPGLHGRAELRARRSSARASGRRRSRRSTRTWANTVAQRAAAAAASWPSTWTARWLYGQLADSRRRPWPEWSQVLGNARCRPRTARATARSACPAAGPGRSRRSRRTPTRPGSFIKMLTPRKASWSTTSTNVQIAVRKDVATTRLPKANPTNAFFTDLVAITDLPAGLRRVPEGLAADPAGDGDGDDQAPSTPDAAAKFYDEASKTSSVKDKTTTSLMTATCVPTAPPHGAVPLGRTPGGRCCAGLPHRAGRGAAGWSSWPARSCTASTPRSPTWRSPAPVGNRSSSASTTSARRSASRAFMQLDLADAGLHARLRDHRAEHARAWCWRC